MFFLTIKHVDFTKPTKMCTNIGFAQMLI
jgi:hypothetical protein